MSEYGAPTQDQVPAPTSPLDQDAATHAATSNDPDDVSLAAHAAHSGAASVSERDEEANEVRSDSDNSVPSGLMMSKRSLDDEEDNDDADAVSWTTRDLPVDASIVLLMAQEMARAQRTDPDPDLAEEGFPEEIRGVDDVSNGLAEMIIQHLQELGISDSAQPPRRQRGEVVEFGEMITDAESSEAEAISPLSLSSGLLDFRARSPSPGQTPAEPEAGSSLSHFRPDSSATHLAISRTVPKSVRSLAMLREGTGSPTHSALLRAAERIAWDTTHGSSTGLQGMDSGLVQGSPLGSSVEADEAGPSSAAGLLGPSGSRSGRATSPVPILTLTRSDSASRDRGSSNSGQ